MTTQARLTVIVPFRDRSEHTLRFASWANLIRYPFPLVFADGGSDTRLETLFADRSRFPNLDYTYVRQAGTTDTTGYMTRVMTACEHVQTPYVMVHPNDDFFLVSVMRQATEFLDAHPDYAGVTGELVDFHTDNRPQLGDLNTVYGRIFVPGKVFRARTYDQPTGLERMTDHIVNMFNNGPVYSVCRTDVFHRMHATAHRLAPPDWHFADRILIFTLLAAGKILGVGPIALHQGNGNTSGLEMITRDPTWLHWAQRPEWGSHFTAVADAVGRHIAEVDGLDVDDAHHRFRHIFYGALGKQVAEFFHPSLKRPIIDIRPEEMAALNAMPDVHGIVRYMAAALERAEKHADVQRG